MWNVLNKDSSSGGSFAFASFRCHRLFASGLVNEREISSAVSAVLRWEDFSCADAVGAEQCGYGDLHQAADAVKVWGLKAVGSGLRRLNGHEMGCR